MKGIALDSLFDPKRIDLCFLDTDFSVAHVYSTGGGWDASNAESGDHMGGVFSSPSVMVATKAAQQLVTAPGGVSTQPAGPASQQLSGPPRQRLPIELPGGLKHIANELPPSASAGLTRVGRTGIPVDTGTASFGFKPRLMCSRSAPTRPCTTRFCGRARSQANLDGRTSAVPSSARRPQRPLRGGTDRSLWARSGPCAARFQPAHAGYRRHGESSVF